MANEITWSSFSSDAGLAEQLNALVHDDLVDMTSLEGFCVNLGDFAGSGSSTKKTTAYTKNNTMAAAGSENANVANSAVTSRNVTTTVARQTIAFEQSDFAHILRGNVLDMQALARMIGDAARRRRNAIIASLFPSVTAQKGTSGAAFTFDAFLEAIYALHIALNPGEAAAVLKPKQWTELIEDSRNEGGPVQMRQDIQQLLDTYGQGAVGTVAGVVCFSSDAVTDDATDFSGGMFSRGAFECGFATAQGIAGAIPLPSGSSVFIEADRTARTALTALVGHDYFGASIREQARAVELLSAI